MTIKISFIGAAGIPNRYGGFESFLEHCAPVIAARGIETRVTCDAKMYVDDLSVDFHGVTREFIGVPANGAASILHDLLAFFRVFPRSTHIAVLGVSGGPWFPLFRLMCALTGKRLAVNIDGVEWRRTKFSLSKRRVLRAFDWLAQRFAHVVIYDSEGLREFVLPGALGKSFCIAYPGDHVRRAPEVPKDPGACLTVCRIEPENNLDLLIQGFLASSMVTYTIIGNWNHSDYARTLRARYRDEPRLQLLDPIYDTVKLARARERCAVYLHGHSVGGTNPSLVEMLFYDCRIACLDVSFNRHTAQGCASYFQDPDSLAALLDAPAADGQGSERARLRESYSAAKIAAAYIEAMTGEP
ncbi:DUF1972 domain-containing protein [Roseateles sp.]|uniref:DUF1972 domain-containing protein n=1 Tax=Roseateles sp. TaxID=1971397 RepID=UPI002F3E85B9